MASELTNFLRKQNKILKEENKELKELLGLNREALRVSSQSEHAEPHYSVLFKLLYEENSKLHQKVNELKLEIETGMCKALISEQIAFASTEHEKYLTEQLKDRLRKMRKELQHRDSKIGQLSKLLSEKPQHLGNEPKIIEFTEMNELTKKFKDHILNLSNEMEEKRQEAAKYKDQKEELLKLNLILTKQINGLKLITSQQSTESKEMRSSSGDLSKFMSYQKKIVQDEEEEDSDDSQGFAESSSESEEMEEPPVNEASKLSKLEISKVPKLELKKAKEIQDLIVQKINNDDLKKKGAVKEENYRKLETEVLKLRRKVGAMAVEKIETERENEFLKKFVKELEGRNELLVQNQRRATEANLPLLRTEENHPETETLLDICRDVTMNQLLRSVVRGMAELPRKRGIISHEV